MTSTGKMCIRDRQAVPSDVQKYLDEIRGNADAAVTQSASAALAAAMTDPEKYIHDNKAVSYTHLDVYKRQGLQLRQRL